MWHNITNNEIRRIDHKDSTITKYSGCCWTHLIVLQHARYQSH